LSKETFESFISLSYLSVVRTLVVSGPSAAVFLDASRISSVETAPVGFFEFAESHSALESRTQERPRLEVGSRIR
jgi:hypothetical protein